MILEIYTDKDVSPMDRNKCLNNIESPQFGKYTTIYNFFVVYKDISFAIVEAICSTLQHVRSPVPKYKFECKHNGPRHSDFEEYTITCMQCGKKLEG